MIYGTRVIATYSSPERIITLSVSMVSRKSLTFGSERALAAASYILSSIACILRVIIAISHSELSMAASI